MRRMRAAGWVMVVGLTQLACATCKTPPPFHVSLEANHVLNGNKTTRVLLLQLKTLDGMKAAEFNELRKNPAQVLGPTLVGEPTILAVSPGEAETRWVERNKDAQFVAAVGIFQNPTPGTWWSWHKLGKVPALQCREVAVESLNRRPLSSEEQMRFFLRDNTLTSDTPADGRAGAAPQPAGRTGA